jgi:hypothetical protein
MKLRQSSMTPQIGLAASISDIEMFLLTSQRETFLRHSVVYAISSIERGYTLFATVQA